MHVAEVLHTSLHMRDFLKLKFRIIYNRATGLEKIYFGSCFNAFSCDICFSSMDRIHNIV